MVHIINTVPIQAQQTMQTLKKITCTIFYLVSVKYTHAFLLAKTVTLIKVVHKM